MRVSQASERKRPPESGRETPPSARPMGCSLAPAAAYLPASSQRQSAKGLMIFDMAQDGSGWQDFTMLSSHSTHGSQSDLA